MDKKIFIDGMMGLVIGDACGVPVEFMSREELKSDPVLDMREYGTYCQPRGTWSDDSSMAIATLASLHQGYNLKDMAEQFCRWRMEGKYTPYGEVFDVGMTCDSAIRRYKDTGDVFSCGLSGDMDNGNGSLMRILPVCIFACEKETEGKMNEAEAVEMIHEVSALTHAHLRSKMACGMYYFFVKAIIKNRNKMSLPQCLQAGADKGLAFYRGASVYSGELFRFTRHFLNLAAFGAADEDSVSSSGYVLATLEAAVWSLLNCGSFESTILKAVNLGEDTDTVGAVAGGLAGLYYGYERMPEAWKNCIVRKEYIMELCDLS